jgi:4-hydroxyphenylpyruvate dioxygenase
MLKSIATVSVSGTLESKLREIAEAGFEGVELFENDLLIYPDTPRVVGAIMRDQGLICTAFQPLRDFEGMPPQARQRVFDRVERKFDVMQELGTELLIVSSNVSPESLGDRARIIDDFSELGQRAAARELRIAYEALAWAKHISDHRDAWAIVKAVNHPAIGMCLDSFNSLVRGVPIDSLRWIDVAKIFYVQMADAPSLAMDMLALSRHFRCMPGQGDMPLVEYLATLQDIGYDGVLSLEIFNDSFHARSTSGVAMDGIRSLTFLEEQVHQRLHPDGAPLMPRRVSCRGIEFLEFCASEEEAPLLAELISTLGFELVGRHRRKAVTRWLQGGINLVINSETEGFAHTFDAVHGASVCAIGLLVGDPSGALDRSRQLQISSFQQAVGPGEFQIPAVRGVGGSLLYFVSDENAPRIWDTEFTRIDGANIREDAGLQRIDHVTQAMQYEELLSWLLYYVALFDVRKTAQVEISDPVGLVLSQAVQSGDGGFRIVLNGSSSAQTLASRFLRNYAGAGVQHIAFATNDIFATAAKVRALGMESLEIPGNYYDDLAARFGLQEPALERLAQFNILYDRDAAGEYFQLFSRAFAKRFFFEIVQRRGYQGFGASNTEIRLAAQSRYKAESPKPDLTHRP